MFSSWTAALDTGHMDTPTAKNQADDAALTSDGPAVDSAAGFGSASRSFDSPAFPPAPRPRKVRSGAIAAGCALAVIIAATAVPNRSGSGGAAASYTPIAKLGMGALPIEQSLPVFDLGEALGTFELPGLPAWNDYANGAAVLSVWFRSTATANAAFAGEIRFDRPVDGAKGATDMMAQINTSLGGAAPDMTFNGTAGYAKITGELFGRGAYDGVVLRLETSSGSIARRGVWTTKGEESVQDAVFARFDWTLEGDPAQGTTLPERGSATLAAKLTPREEN